MDKFLFMQACREGGASRIEAALVSLHHDYGPALFREGVRCLGEPEAAQALVHETLIKACRSSTSLSGNAELLPWLRHLLRSALVERLLGGRPQPDTRGQVLPPLALSLQAADQALQDAGLEACWRDCAARFSREYALAASVMRWVAEDDLSLEQIGELLQRTPSATGEFITQCRRQARACFADWYAMLRPQ